MAGRMVGGMSESEMVRIWKEFGEAMRAFCEVVARLHDAGALPPECYGTGSVAKAAFEPLVKVQKRGA